MQTERHEATSPNLRIVPDGHADLRTNGIPDTRRFAGVFPLDVPETTSADRGDAPHGEQDDIDRPSPFEFVAVADKNASTSQVAPIASADTGSSTLSAAQQIIARYRAVHVTRIPAMAETGDFVPHLPDDQHSMYTLATSSDTQSMMDMMWRPKPKVHMCRADQRALMQAQSQAIAMMNNAGLKPTSKIQCRRRGCADILPDVEALKYHLHIHNIADSAGKHHDVSASTVRKPSPLAECSVPNSQALKRNHSRSKSYLGTDRERLVTSPPPRKLSVGSILPSLFSPRESAPGTSDVPSLTTFAKALIPDPIPNKPAGLLPVRTDETPSTHISTPSRGRRKRKESMAISVDTESNPSIAMLLSPPSSPKMRGRLVLAPRVKLPVPVALGTIKDSKSDNSISIRDEGTHPISEQLTGSRNPVRALSPTRAMSPIRDGIKRILAMG